MRASVLEHGRWRRTEGVNRIADLQISPGCRVGVLVECGLPQALDDSLHGGQMYQEQQRLLRPRGSDQLRTKATPEEIPVVIGDMATTRIDGQFTLVYLVFNTIGNLRTQDEQVECFRNAADHLAPGGHFLIELWVPGIRRLPPGQTAVPFEVTENHTGLDTYDPVTQQGTSHHYTRLEDGTYRYSRSKFRYIWPAECDLMARLAGLETVGRWANWDRSAFTSESTSHISLWRKPPTAR